MYIDADHDIILETLEELESWVKSLEDWKGSCNRCLAEGRVMIATLKHTNVHTLVFSTTCDHRK